MAKLLYQGHGSLRIVTAQGSTVYLDPYAGDGYDLPADLILITHEHPDHNQIVLVQQKPECQIIRSTDMLVNGEYLTKECCGIKIRSVPAYNRMHEKESCVGYLLQTDGVRLYFAGDTSTTEYMSEVLGRENIDYAFLPTDGYYTMDIEEALRCVKMIGAKHSIPIHMAPGKLFDGEKAKAFLTESALILEPGEEIQLVASETD